jgi:hypothetical protein
MVGQKIYSMMNGELGMLPQTRLFMVNGGVELFSGWSRRRQVHLLQKFQDFIRTSFSGILLRKKNHGDLQYKQALLRAVREGDR